MKGCSFCISNLMVRCLSYFPQFNRHARYSSHVFWFREPTLRNSLKQAKGYIISMIRYYGRYKPLEATPCTRRIHKKLYLHINMKSLPRHIMSSTYSQQRLGCYLTELYMLQGYVWYAAYFEMNDHVDSSTRKSKEYGRQHGGCIHFTSSIYLWWNGTARGCHPGGCHAQRDTW